MLRRSPESIYFQHRLFLIELYRIVEESTALAVDDFARRGRTIEDYHLASYVRNETKERVRELAGTSLSCGLREDLRNNSVTMTREGDAFKLRKRKRSFCITPYGEPAPSQSRAMRRYFEQQSLELYAPGSDEAYRHGSLNFFLIWDFDRGTETVGNIDLVMPGVWRLGIEHPAKAADDGSAPPVVFEDLEFEQDAGLDEEERDEGAAED